MNLNRNWVFTLNNPPAGFDLVDHEATKYGTYQRERGENGTEHIQGYLVFKTVKSLETLKRIIPRAHWEIRKGTHIEARDYCQKEDTKIGETVTWGIEPRPGKRTDLVDGVRFLREGCSFAELVDKIGNSAIRYKRHLYEAADSIDQAVTKKRIKLNFEEAVLRDWQKHLLDKIMEEPDERSVYWITDEIGNQGKTWFAKYLVHTKGAALFGNNKSADVKYAFKGERIAIFDLCRSTEDRVNYEVIESIKNGIFFSSKYGSETKSYECPHVIVLSNFGPDKSKLSDDRWKIINLINPF